MRTILIYDDGEKYEANILIIEFEDCDKMIDFINEKKIGDKIISSYEIYKEIKFEAVEKIIKYKIKE